MNEQQLAALKQALELMHNRGDVGVDEWIAAEAALQSIISQDALYKMAEDAVTIGLSYNDWPKIGCVNHDCDRCRAVQEPAACKTMCELCLKRGYDFCANAVKTTPIPTPPAAQKPWVGLTDGEVMQTMSGDWTSQFYFARAIEAKLKEKNT
jgi:hypothetical protein